MRDIAHIWEAWSTDIPKVGEFKPCSRVTVEKSFWLNVTASRTVGTWTRGPARWYQRFDTNDQVETEIPNIKNVSIERSIESDAGQCTIVLANTAELAWGELEETPGQHGRPGFYTWSRGVSQDAVSRWGHVINEWRDVLVPNALLRTYQGYGGHDKNLFDAVSDGNVVLTGVWMVDTVSTGTSGDLTLQCRDVAKLLLDQMLFPPLVPMAEYPLLYQRYTYEYFQIPPEPAPGIEHEIITRSTASLDGLGDYVDGPDFTVRASSDPDGANAVVFGHRPADALDLSFDPPGSDGTFAHQWTYWLSNGYGDRNGFPWIEANAQNTEVNLVMFHPWAGNYLVYVSVWEGGGWVAPEDGGQGGIIPTDDPAAAIPYVTSFGANWEGGEPPGQFNNRYPLPRTYQAAKIRVTLTNLVASQEGGFRGGIRKLAPEYDYTAAHYPSLVFTCCPHPNTAGYWQCRSDGRHYAFGEARVGALSPTNPVQTQNGYVMAINANRDGTGYWTVDNFGRILAFGTAEWLGDMSGSGRGDIVDFAPTPMGLGYWILCRDGSVHPCGEADNHGFDLVTGLMPSGSPIQARAIESHPFDYGYWILWSDGTVHSHDLTYYGHANRVGFGLTEYVGKLRRTKTGNGYMINSGGGLMQYFGDACHSGNGIRRAATDWVKGLCWDFTPDWEAAPGVAGVAVQHADGTLDYLGNFRPFGSIASGQGTLRKAGNYADYSDIVRELLLWSGFYWMRDPQPNELPDVYANVETTGAFAVEDLPAEMFDKKSVMDAIHALKEIVGYITFVDDEGAFRFESPNWWSKGNYDFEGHQLDLMPEIDEKVQLFDYTIQFHDSEARSEIIVASENPYPMVHGADAPTGVATSRYVPPSAPDLKGMIKPAMWTNGVFVDDKEQMMMAQLIAMHIWFARRTGDVTCLANPLIGPNDQVQIYERRTGEVYVHYVRGTRINHDLETGDFQQTLTTHWLGGTPVNTSPFLFSCATRPQYDGYWQVNAAGGVFAFGAAETYLPNRKSENFEAILTIRSTPTGLGYYTLGGGGEIIPYGDAVHYGMIINRKLNTKDMALTPSGNGYWVLTADGHVQAHGDAIWRGDAEVSGEMPSEAPIQAESIEAHPNGAGYWILRSDGLVTGHGIADYGSANRDGYNPTEYTSCLRCTPDGGGYYIPSGDGLIQVFGNAVHYGNGIHRPRINDFFGIVWDMMVVNGGYALQHADGLLDTMGAFVDHGSVMATTDPSNWVIDDPDSGSTDPNVLHISDQLRGYTKRIESKSTSDSAFLAGEAPLTEKARP